MIGRLLVLALAALGLVTAGAASANPIAVSDGWTRPAAAGLNGAGYITVINRGSRPDRLMSASSAVASAVSIHRSLQVGGVMTMRTLPFVEVGAGSRVTFAPGGLHLMLEGLRRPLRAGESVPVSLSFAKAGQVSARLEVRAATAMPGMGN